MWRFTYIFSTYLSNVTLETSNKLYSFIPEVTFTALQLHYDFDLHPENNILIKRDTKKVHQGEANLQCEYLKQPYRRPSKTSKQLSSAQNSHARQYCNCRAKDNILL